MGVESGLLASNTNREPSIHGRISFDPGDGQGASWMSGSVRGEAGGDKSAGFEVRLGVTIGGGSRLDNEAMVAVGEQRGEGRMCVSEDGGELVTVVAADSCMT